MHAKGVAPTLAHQAALFAMLDDFEANDPANAAFYAPARGDFVGYVRNLLDHERGVNLPDGWVPCTHRWLLADDGAVVGVTRLRHTIDTPFLTNEGGHIGYDIAPAQRRKGYGHLALRVALAQAAARRIPRVLLIANEDNAASRAVIERQGGKLESIAFSDFWHERLCRYWIDVAAVD